MKKARVGIIVDNLNSSKQIFDFITASQKSNNYEDQKDKSHINNMWQAKKMTVSHSIQRYVSPIYKIKHHGLVEDS